MHRPQRWDIFCAVIDNFGDAGVCWRLARQLAAEHGYVVRLIIDDLASLAMLAPKLDPRAPLQILAGVTVVPREQAPTDAADVVIEAFGAPVPEAYLAAMVETPPVWINLEYLSAEAWIEGCHCLPSPHPRLPLTQWFFYPGFTEQSGGLLREARLIADREAFQAVPGAFAGFLDGQGLRPPEPEALKISLFGYENPALAGLIKAWSHSSRPIWCAVPEGRIRASVESTLGKPLSTTQHRGALTLEPIPFLAQDDYDRLLWGCDLNFVRGEDSFVRAQWAARPLVWHIYPQDEQAHLVKLEAFLDRYHEGLASAPAEASIALHDAWNRSEGARVEALWPQFEDALPELAQHARRFAQALADQPDLATQLALFAKSKLK
ncbi:elongation factor P maturation arginine rhamnosyltransferase EarP [Niveibacterium terrae]|uniref:elongation factor P maturation arginine rhamnosyltransferase EarP n=1 Tax=Niveibacterium terrae TaxID=3373598 RepID=UPI003A93C281